MCNQKTKIKKKCRILNKKTEVENILIAACLINKKDIKNRRRKKFCVKREILMQIEKKKKK